MHTPTLSLSARARRARSRGATHFTAECRIHGRATFYVASRRCMRCTAEGKNPLRQAVYWAAHAEAISAARKVKRAAEHH